MNWTYKPEKRLGSKRVRQALARQIPEKLADDYTPEDFMGDICTDESPCPWCIAAAKRRAEPAGGVIEQADRMDEKP